MLKELLKNTFAKLKDRIISSIDVGGYTIPEIMKESNSNTARAYKKLMERAIKNNFDAETLERGLEGLRHSRQTHLLTSSKNIMSATRGWARSLLTIGRSGRFYNVTVLDSNTTHVCLREVGNSWPKPYSAIPNKPPRIQELIHRCRSYLEFRNKPPTDTDNFMQKWNKGGDELKLKLLKPVRFKAYKDGHLKINSYAQFEKVVLFKIKELKLPLRSKK